MSKPEEYVIRGTVQAGGGRYVERVADEELLVLCRNRSFVYVLTTRQVGKSSLMTHTAETLLSEGINTVIVDLSEHGTEGVSAEQWYSALLGTIQDQLPLDTDCLKWWRAHTGLPFTTRLTTFFKEVLLVEIKEPIVIFVDEIETTLDLRFTDDFYAAIRAVYNARSRVTEYNRLSFVLFGVANPTDLVRDPKRTPFNIGNRIDLTDFTLDEALNLSSGLGLEPSKASAVFGRILFWTGGHPYLTLRICRALAEEDRNCWTESDIDSIVTELFFASESDDNLEFVRDRMLRGSEDLESVLTLYREIYRHKTIIPDDDQSVVKSHLKLAGIVRRENNLLVVRNRIYEKAFDEKWVKEHLPINWTRRLSTTAAVLALILLVLSLPLSVYALLKKSELESKKSQVELLLSEARKRSESLEEANKTAEELKTLAEQQKTKATQFASSENVAKREALSALAREKVATREAIVRKAEAEEERKVSYSRELALGALSQLSVDPDLSLLLSAESVRAGNTIQAESALRRALISSSSRRILKHDWVMDAQLSPDGSQAASAGLDGRVRVWDLATGKESFTRPSDSERNQYKFTNVQFSPDGLLVIGTSTHEITIWDTNGKNIKSLKLAESDTIQRTVVSPDGKRIAISTAVPFLSSSTVTVWEVRGEWRKLFSLQQHEIVGLDFSIDGRQLLTQERSGKGNLWDSTTGQLVVSLPETTGIHNGACFSQDGKLIATISDLKVQVWTNRGRALYELIGHAKDITSVSFSPNGSYLATTSDDQTVRLWDASNGLGKSVWSAPGSVNAQFSQDSALVVTHGYSNDVRIWSVDTVSNIPLAILHSQTEPITTAKFGPKGYTLITAGEQNVRIWEPFFNTVRLEAGGALTTAEFDHTGDYILTIDNSNTTSIWNASSGIKLRNLTSKDQQTHLVDAIFSPNGNHVLTIGASSKPQLWDYENGVLINSFEQYNRSSSIVRASFNPLNETIVAAGTDGNAYIYAPIDDRLYFKLNHGNIQGLSSASFSKDGKLVLTSSYDKTARIWDATTGTLLRTFVHGTEVQCAAFSPSGERVVTGGRDGSVKVWNTSTSQARSVLKEGGGSVSSVAFSPDGQLILIHTADNISRLWDMQSGHLLANYESDCEVAMDSFSPNGKFVVTARNATSYLWDIETGQNLLPLPGHLSLVKTVYFSRDGLRIVTASQDGSAIVYACDICGSLTSLITLASKRILENGRDFSDAERNRFLH